MKQWLIYKHTSMKSGKSYIGLTCRSMEERWLEHKSRANTGSDLHFHRAIRLYGFENWGHEILTEGIDTLEEAEALEKYYIKKCDTFENGYNSNTGGQVNEMSEDSIKKMTEGIRRSHNTQIVEFWNYNTNEKLVGYPGDIEKALGVDAGRLSSVARGNSKSYKGIVLFTDYEDGYDPRVNKHRFEHKNHGTIEESLGSMLTRFSELSNGNLSQVIYGSRISHKGWTLEGNQHLIGVMPQDKRSKAVIQYDIETSEILAEYPSVNKGAKLAGMSAATLRKKCTGEIKDNTWNGSYFKYKEIK